MKPSVAQPEAEASSPSERPEDVLIIAESESDSNLYYATGFLVPDPLVYLELAGERILLVKDLEYGRALDEARVDRVVAANRFDDELRSRNETPTPASILDLFLRTSDGSRRQSGLLEFTVPANFPLGEAEKLRDLGYRLRVREDPFFPDRAVKGAEEVETIRKSQAAAEGCMAFVIERLRRSEIRGDRLYRDGQELTADRLRSDAQVFLLERGYVATNLIIAGGDQGCDPHHRGSGPLPANRTIVIDVFPRCLETRYWGDLTRTVVRGEASAEVKKLYQDVLEVQRIAMELLREGADGRNVHTTVVDAFQDRGNRNEERNGKKTGYIHGTGHGVGLDIHEAPSLGKVACPLKAGHVVTVEPGLYYPGIGAVRIEDLVLVTEDGYRNLTAFPKELEI